MKTCEFFSPEYCKFSIFLLTSKVTFTHNFCKKKRKMFFYQWLRRLLCTIFVKEFLKSKKKFLPTTQALFMNNFCEKWKKSKKNSIEYYNFPIFLLLTSKVPLIHLFKKKRKKIENFRARLYWILQCPNFSCTD